MAKSEAWNSILSSIVTQLASLPLRCYNCPKKQGSGPQRLEVDISSSDNDVILLSCKSVGFTILAEPSYKIIWTFSYSFGKIHPIDAMEDHCVNLNRVWSRKGGAASKTTMFTTYIFTYFILKHLYNQRGEGGVGTHFLSQIYHMIVFYLGKFKRKKRKYLKKKRKNAKGKFF